MKIIKQSHEFLYIAGGITSIEMAARTCYKSENLIKEGSDLALFKKLFNSGHHAMLEFGIAIIKFITNRGVTHELVRHRLCSFAQESTRYCNYSKDKFGSELTFIKPVWWNEEKNRGITSTFIGALTHAEENYLYLLDEGWTPQQAREVLPNALKTEIVVMANLREWRHIFKQRCSEAAHPQMRSLMLDCLYRMNELIPHVFEDLAKEFLDD